MRVKRPKWTTTLAKEPEVEVVIDVEPQIEVLQFREFCTAEEGFGGVDFIDVAYESGSSFSHEFHDDAMEHISMSDRKFQYADFDHVNVMGMRVVQNVQSEVVLDNPTPEEPQESRPEEIAVSDPEPLPVTPTSRPRTQLPRTFLIGEMAKLFQVDVRTLRYYDEIGLLKPEMVNDGTNYRHYTVDQFEQLNTIIYLKSLNMSLADINSFIKHRDVDKMLELLKAQQENTERKIEEFTKIQRKILGRIAQISDASNKNELLKIREDEIAERDIVVLRQNIRSDDNLELAIRQLENSANLKSTIFLGKVGLSVSLFDLKQDQFKDYSALFVVLEKEDNGFMAESKLPGGKHCCLRFAGSHEDAEMYYRILTQYIKGKEYQIAGDSVEITFIDYGLTNNRSEFVTEIQIPVK